MKSCLWIFGLVELFWGRISDFFGGKVRPERPRINIGQPGGLVDGSPRSGVPGKAPVGSLGDDVPRS